MAIPTEYVPPVFYQKLKKITAFATITNGDTDSICPVGILLIVAKKITTHATITDVFPNRITDGRCKFQCVRLSDSEVGQHIYRRKRQIQCARALTPIYRRMCRRTSKIWRDFQILVGNLKNTNGHYRQNLMPPPKKILFYVPLITLQCKT